MREWRDEARGSMVLDDASIEALFRDEPVPEELAAVAVAVGVLRSAAHRPVLPSAELAERMATGNFGDALPEPVPTVPGAHRKPPQMGVRAKVAIGALAGFFGLTVATVAGALPAPLQMGLETFVELVTPVEIDHDVPEQDPLQEEPSGQFDGRRPDRRIGQNPCRSGRPRDPHAGHHSRRRTIDIRATGSGGTGRLGRPARHDGRRRRLRHRRRTGRCVRRPDDGPDSRPRT